MNKKINIKHYAVIIFVIVAVLSGMLGLYARNMIEDFKLLAVDNANPGFYRAYPYYFAVCTIFAAAAFITAFFSTAKAAISKHRKDIKEKGKEELIKNAAGAENGLEPLKDSKTQKKAKKTGMCDCGCPIDDSMLFCPDCGKKLK